jgi:exoribonuclease R
MMLSWTGCSLTKRVGSKYNRKRRDARRIIAECKREVNSIWSELLTNAFIESKKIFQRVCTEEGRPK